MAQDGFWRLLDFYRTTTSTLDSHETREHNFEIGVVLLEVLERVCSALRAVNSPRLFHRIAFTSESGLLRTVCVQPFSLAVVTFVLGHLRGFRCRTLSTWAAPSTPGGSRGIAGIALSTFGSSHECEPLDIRGGAWFPERILTNDET